MGYAEYLKNLLAPLGFYDPGDPYGAAELVACGGALDALFGGLEAAEAESLVPTATGEGLSNWEALLPFTPSFASLESRRGAICALLSIDGASFTLEALRRTISGCGIPAEIAESPSKPYTVEVRFPGVRGVPENFGALKARVGQILPCHLGVDYAFVYITWAELEAYFPAWAALTALGLDWRNLEKYPG